MAEVGLIASALGVVTVAWSLSKSTYDFIDQIRDVPKDVKILRDDCKSLHSSLGTLRNLLTDMERSDESHSSTIRDALKSLEDVLKRCPDTLMELQKLIKQSFNPSGTAIGNFWRSTTFVFRESNLRKMKEQLHQYKSTVNISVDVATLCVTLSTENRARKMEGRQNQILLEVSDLRQNLNNFVIYTNDESTSSAIDGSNESGTDYQFALRRFLQAAESAATKSLADLSNDDSIPENLQNIHNTSATPVFAAITEQPSTSQTILTVPNSPVVHEQSQDATIKAYSACTAGAVREKETNDIGPPVLGNEKEAKKMEKIKPPKNIKTISNDPQKVAIFIMGQKHLEMKDFQTSATNELKLSLPIQANFLSMSYSLAIEYGEREVMLIPFETDPMELTGRALWLAEFAWWQEKIYAEGFSIGGLILFVDACQFRYKSQQEQLLRDKLYAADMLSRLKTVEKMLGVEELSGAVVVIQSDLDDSEIPGEHRLAQEWEWKGSIEFAKDGQDWMPGVLSEILSKNLEIVPKFAQEMFMEDLTLGETSAGLEIVRHLDLMSQWSPSHAGIYIAAEKELLSARQTNLVAALQRGSETHRKLT